MRHTPLFHQHQNLGATIINLKGVARPMEYRGHSEEHHATRNGVTLCDVSHMGEITFSGKDAIPFLQKLIVGNAEKLHDGQAMYSALCNEDGHVMDDLVVMRLAEDRLLMVVNVTMIEKDYQWMLRHKDGFDVEIADVSTATALMALQGPLSREVLQKIVRADLSEMAYYSVVETEIITLDGGTIPCVVSRTGYTGEIGFEICVDRDGAPFIWEELMRAGRAMGIMGQGVAARESLRTEAGLLLNGNDMDGKTTPYEAGLSWLVDLSTDFIGRDALEKAKKDGPSKKMVGLKIANGVTVRYGYPIFASQDAKEKIGVVTSGPLGGALCGESYGLAYVRPDLAAKGQVLYVEAFGELHAAEVVGLPFLPRRAKDVPAVRTLSPFALQFINEYFWTVPCGDGLWKVGLTEFAASHFGEFLYCRAPREGAFEAGKPVAWLDSYRGVLPITLPFGGEIVEVNKEAVAKPGDINRYPYHEKGLFLCRPKGSMPDLMDVEAWMHRVRELSAYATWSNERRTV